MDYLILTSNFRPLFHVKRLKNIFFGISAGGVWTPGTRKKLLATVNRHEDVYSRRIFPISALCSLFRRYFVQTRYDICRSMLYVLDHCCHSSSECPPFGIPVQMSACTFSPYQKKFLFQYGSLTLFPPPAQPKVFSRQKVGTSDTACSDFSLSKKEVSSEGMKPPSEIKRVKEEEKGERVGMAGVP